MPDITPILKSFVDPVHLAIRIEREYGLRGVRCQLIKATMRDVYDVRCNGPDGRFIAALYPAHAVEEYVQAEMTVIEQSHAAGIATARPLLRSSGEHMVPLVLPEGRRCLVLFDYIGGEPFPRQPTAAQISAYGAALAALHEALERVATSLARPRWTRSLLIDKPLAQIAQVLNLHTGAIDLLRQSAETLGERIGELPETLPAFGLIHGDVIPSNAILGQGGRLHLIDFDLCGYGWRIYDVATFFNEIGYWGMGEDAENAFLAGYETLRPLASAEKAMIPILGAARCIWALGNAAAHVDTWGSHLYLGARVVEGELNSLRRNLARLAAGG